eukprot:5363364-Pyramimonas_sp.AAC.1
MAFPLIIRCTALHCTALHCTALDLHCELHWTCTGCGGPWIPTTPGPGPGPERNDDAERAGVQGHRLLRGGAPGEEDPRPHPHQRGDPAGPVQQSSGIVVQRCSKVVQWNTVTFRGRTNHPLDGNTEDENTDDAETNPLG